MLFTEPHRKEFSQLGKSCAIPRPPKCTLGYGGFGDASRSSKSRIGWRIASQISLDFRRVAQLAEHPDYTGEVAGSNPAPPTKFRFVMRRVAKEDRSALNPWRFLCGGGWANKFPLVFY